MMTLSRLLLACLLAAATLAGCSGEAEQQRIVLGFSQVGSESAWRLANSESIKSAAATSNIELIFSDAQQKQQNQIVALRQFIADKVDVIAFAPVIATGWEPVLEEAKAAGIPVILTDRGVSADASLYAGFLGSDFVEEGRKAARWVVNRFPDDKTPLNIVELEGTPGAAPASDRKKGFEEIISRHANMRILRSEAADFERARGETVMAEILAVEKQKIHVLFAHNDDMALGAIHAIEAAGLRPGNDIVIVSIDAVRDAFIAMIAGKLNATVECNPLLGPQLMTSVTEVVSGRPIPKRIIVDEAVFTQDNARQFIQTRKY
jgi:galactofuranose transport system substrate-binding protein